MISLIACVGKNNELGKDNQLCFHLKTDMEFFKNMTFGQSVVMGRKTYESIGHPLPERKNYVLTSGNNVIAGKMVYTISNLNEFLDAVTEDVFIIGGASVYEQALPYADVIYLTEVDADADADAFFPEFDKTLYKRKVLKTGDNFKIVEYRRKKCL